MKRILILIVQLAPSVIAYGQGYVHFRNSSTTLISAGGVPMPGTQQFIFAMFLAPSTTVTSTGITPTYSDPIWQNVGGYNTNNAIAPGRIITRLDVDVGTPSGFSGGSAVDFIIRGWSANAGSTWSQALANWNNGSPLLPMFIGSSTVGNNIFLDTDLNTPTVFGIGSDQVPGFDMIFVPEPTTGSVLLLAGAAFLRYRKSRSKA